MPTKWQRFKGEEKEEEANSPSEPKESREDTPNPKKSANGPVNFSVNGATEQDESGASKNGNRDEQEFYRNLLAQHRAALQQVLSENYERTLEGVMQQMTSIQAKITERHAESQVQARKVDDVVAPPQLLGATADSPLLQLPEPENRMCQALSTKTVGFRASAMDRTPSGAVATTTYGKSDNRKTGKRLPQGHRSGMNARLFQSRKFTRIFEERQLPEPGQGGVFADAEAIKAKLRKDMSQPSYDVTQFYHDTGLCQSVARSGYFENVTLFVIAFNAIWIAVDVDLNPATLLVDASLTFQIVDNFFCTYFVSELAFRFGAFASKANCLKDAWFVFDFFMCTLMVLETWVLTFFVLVFSIKSEQGMSDASLLKAFRLVRLMRMARVLRLLRALPELMVVIKGMAVATRAVSCTVALMLLIIYVFAVLFRQLTDGTGLGKSHFPSVLVTMRFLLLHGTMPDVEEISVLIWDESMVYAVLFLFFILVITITVMNMLAGVLVGVVNTVANVEKEQLTINFVKDNLLVILRTVQDADRDHNAISRDEFVELLKNTSAVRAFDMMGVDVCGLVDLVDFIFKDNMELTFADFMEIVMQLRGSNHTTVKDIVDLRKFIHAEIKFLQRVTTDLHNGISTASGGTASSGKTPTGRASIAPENRPADTGVVALEPIPIPDVSSCQSAASLTSEPEKMASVPLMAASVPVPLMAPLPAPAAAPAVRASMAAGSPPSSTETNKEDVSDDHHTRFHKKRTQRSKSVQKQI